MVSADLAELRRDTEEIIAVKPSMISFNRKIVTTDETRRKTVTKVELDAQRCRIAETSNNETDRLMEQGTIPSHIVNITAPHDADIKKGDRFQYKGENFEVLFIRSYEFYEDGIYKWSGKAREIAEAL